MIADTLHMPAFATDIDELRGELRTLTLQWRGERARRQYWSGREWQLGSASYWEEITRSARKPTHYHLGGTLAEEIGACLLGGYGIPFELGNAAFKRLQAERVFAEPGWTEEAVERLLTQPLLLGGVTRRYRFPRQKARRLVGAMTALRRQTPPTEPLALRDWLVGLPGVGLKTASWVVWNHTGTNDVAIIDIHIVRAGTAAGVFDRGWRLPRDYGMFEQAFVQWSRQSALPASLLDACIWGALSNADLDARDILGTATLSQLPEPVWPV